MKNCLIILLLLVNCSEQSSQKPQKRELTSKDKTVQESNDVAIGDNESDTRAEKDLEADDSSKSAAKVKSPPSSQPLPRNLPPRPKEPNEGPDLSDATVLEPSEGLSPSLEKPEDVVYNPSWSLGKGGVTGLQEVAFESSNGQASSYKIEAPEDIGDDKAYGLHIHLHGDGGGGYRDFPNQETRYGLMGVTVKAPNQTLQWGRQEGEVHAVFLNELIKDLTKKYNIDQDKIYFSGVSGGAYFLSGNFIPTFGHLYKSGAFLMCGGEAPRTEFVKKEFLANFRIHWQFTAGERRDIKRSIAASIESYSAELEGLADAEPDIQSSEEKGEGGHCIFDGESYTTGIQQMTDDQFSMILKEDMVQDFEAN